MNELRKLQQKRIKESFFDEDDNLTLDICSKTRDITNIIKRSEMKPRELVNVKVTV